MTNGTSTNPPQLPATSAASPTDDQAWQKLLADSAKPKTPAQIRAAGDVTVRVGVLWVVGVTCGVLSIAGVAMFFWNAGAAKDLWVIIGPIITAGITGILGYLTGEKSTSGK